MSVATVDRDTYDRFYTLQVASYLDQGLDLAAARVMAAEIMSQCFRCDEAVQQHEHQRDRDEYVEEMSLGGEPYNDNRS